MGRGRDGAELVEIQHHQGKAGATSEQVGSAQGRPEPGATLHPEQRGEIDPRRRGGRRIERVHPVDEGHLATRSRDAGNEGQEQAAGSGGPGTDDLAEPARREATEQVVDPFALPPWRR